MTDPITLLCMNLMMHLMLPMNRFRGMRSVDRPPPNMKSMMSTRTSVIVS